MFLPKTPAHAKLVAVEIWPYYHLYQSVCDVILMLFIDSYWAFVLFLRSVTLSPDRDGASDSERNNSSEPFADITALRQIYCLPGQEIWIDQAVSHNSQ